MCSVNAGFRWAAAPVEAIPTLPGMVCDFPMPRSMEMDRSGPPYKAEVEREGRWAAAPAEAIPTLPALVGDFPTPRSMGMERSGPPYQLPYELPFARMSCA